MPDLIPHLSHSEAGPSTIVFIHGAASSPAEFVPLIAHVPAYHLLVPSYSHISPFTFESVVQPLIALIEAKAKDGKAHVVGHSIGAHLALALADQRPDLIETLFVSGYTRLDSTKSTSRMMLYGAVATEYIGNSMSPYVRSKVVDIPQEITKIQKEAEKEWPCEEITVARGREYLAAMSEPPDTPYWSAKGVPRVLVVAATKGTWLAPTADSVDNAKSLGEAMRGHTEVRVVQHKAMRHQWTLQDPKLFAGTVVGWIEGKALATGFEDL